MLGAFVLGTVLKKQNVTTKEIVEYRSSSPASEKGEGGAEEERVEREGENLSVPMDQVPNIFKPRPNDPLSQPGPAS